MRHTIPKASFFQKTRRSLSGKLAKSTVAVFQSADRILRNGDQHYPYRQDSNFFYLTGIESPGCKLVVFQENFFGSDQEILFIPKVDPKKEAWEGEMLTKEQATEISGVEKVVYLDKFDGLIHRHLKNASSFSICHQDYPNEAQSAGIVRWINNLKNQYPGLEIKHLNNTMAELRMKKHPEEIDLIKQAISITEKGLRAVFSSIQPGLWEFDVEAILMKAFIQNRSMMVAFPPIVAAGINATTLHYSTNHCQIQEGDLVLIDVGADFGYYSSDITRTIPATGNFSERQKELYSGLLEIQKSFIRKVKPGMKLSDLTKQSKQDVGKFLQSIGLIDTIDDVLKYYFHNLSHHLGIDTHDVALMNVPLEAGNVITIEPGIYIPEENIGIRIEDDILVTETGFDNLSKGIPKEINELELLIHGRT